MIALVSAPVVLVAFCAVMGALLGNVLVGLAVGLGIVLLATLARAA